MYRFHPSVGFDLTPTVALPTELNDAKWERVMVVICGRANNMCTMSSTIAFTISQLLETKKFTTLTEKRRESETRSYLVRYE